MLELCRQESNLLQKQQDIVQLMFIISDGRFGDTKKSLQEWICRASEHHIFIVFLVLDCCFDKESSILDIQSISYPNNKLTIKSYIDEFPFPYYIILRNIQNLPTVLGDALRQWFELIQQK
jgi:midasin